MTSEQLTRHFTLDEALEVAGTTPDEPNPTSRAGEHDGWAGGSFEDAMDKARNGDPQAAARLRRRLGQYAGIRGAKRATFTYDVAGSVPDIGRFLSGESENMVQTMRARRSVPVMKLAIERCVHSGTSTSTMEATGASVLAAVEALRTAGVPSEIWVTFTAQSHRTGRRISNQILIQEAGRPIDLDRLAYWTVNPTALRRIHFALMERENAALRSEFGAIRHGGYSMPTVADRDDYDEVAPAYETEVATWLDDVLSRRAGVTIDRRSN